MLQAQALYDFEAQPGTGELNLISGDILTVTRTDVGEGWWEGTNAKGESGLFPEAYVEVSLAVYMMKHFKVLLKLGGGGGSPNAITRKITLLFPNNKFQNM